MSAVDVIIPTTTSEPLKKPAKRRRKTRQQRFREKQPRRDYTPIVKDNANLIKYYKAQSIFPAEEFDEFIDGLKQTLPAAFRINTFDLSQANFLRHLVEGPEFHEFLTAPVKPSICHESALENDDGDDDDGDDGEEGKGEDEDDEEENGKNDEEEGEPDAAALPNNGAQDKPPALESLGWYPKRLAWQMNITRLDLKKTPLLQQLHKFIMAETDNGYISRQEAVSMIPPLVLDVHRGQDILDMCAAPGSKTAQLLEYLKHEIIDSQQQPSSEQQPTVSKDLFDDGMIVANDIDNKRCYMLVHQSSRLNSPNCIIINQDAARMPEIKTLNEGESQEFPLKFDRVLCDVPCSGDGTIRKNPDVWKKWSVGNANNFHGMQCKILKRGIELLKANGLLVYSTCSMNPIEDEAVIASILRASQGQVILEDAAHKLPGLKYRPGTSEWVVMNRDMEVISSSDKVPRENVTQLYPSLFPPTDEESKSFNLHKCIRILPHLQNTGGFFVALLRKLTDQMPWQIKPTEADAKETPVEPKPVPPNPKKRRFGGFKEDPFNFVEKDDPDWISIKNGYGLNDDFPVGQLVHRSTCGKKRCIYLVSKRTRSFIIANREEPDRKDFVKIINSGMRLFSRADTSAGFRICQDGVCEILPYIKDDIKVPINKDDLVGLLKAPSVSFDKLSSAEHIKSKINPGSFILMYKHDDPENTDNSFVLPLVAWKGEWTVALYVSRTYRVHLCALAQLGIGEEGVLKKPEETKLTCDNSNHGSEDDNTNADNVLKTKEIDQ